MENLLSRHRNLTVLVLVLFVQVVGLAVQVKRPTEGGSARLLRVWAVSAVTPLEKGVVHSRSWFGGVWRNYFDLRNVRKENQGLRDENQRLRLEAVRLAEDASQARRLQALLAFKEQYIEQTLAAQVISTTGSEFSRGIYIDKGTRDGVGVDMPVITPEGIVGKVFRTYPGSSLVLEINDPSSGAGVILDKSRLQGIVKGNAEGETLVQNIMAEEQVEVGERVLTSGGDRIFPKGMPVGVVSSVTRDKRKDMFLTVRVKPAANLNRLEEVLVITRITEKPPEIDNTGPRQRAADIRAERLPQVPPKPPETTAGAKPGTPGAAGAAAGNAVPPTGAPATIVKPPVTATQTPPGSEPKLSTKPPAAATRQTPSASEPKPSTMKPPAQKPPATGPGTPAAVDAAGKPAVKPTVPPATKDKPRP